MTWAAAGMDADRPAVPSTVTSGRATDIETAESGAGDAAAAHRAVSGRTGSWAHPGVGIRKSDMRSRTKAAIQQKSPHLRRGLGGCSGTVPRRYSRGQKGCAPPYGGRWGARRAASLWSRRLLAVSGAAESGPSARVQAGLLAHRWRPAAGQARAWTRSTAPLPIAACRSQKRRATSLRSGEPVSARVHASNHSCGDSPRLVRIRAGGVEGEGPKFREGRQRHIPNVHDHAPRRRHWRSLFISTGRCRRENPRRV